MVMTPPTRTEISWPQLFDLGLASWRRIAGWSTLAAVAAASIAFLLPPRYLAEASFIPQVRQSSSAIGGIAAQLGVDVSTGDPTQTPHFFVELLRSPDFLGGLAGSYPTAEGTTTLADLVGVDPEASLNPAWRLGGELSSRINTLVAPRTGVIHIGVELSDSLAAVAVLDSILTKLDAFNVAVRRSRAQAERSFTETRVRQLREELLAAETQLEDFLMRNRAIQSPELAFQRDRLLREVALRQQVYSSMVQAFEQARIDEVRDTPVITRLSRPALAPRSAGPRPLRYALSAAFLTAAGLLAVLAWGLVRVRDRT